jgi:hypothetical protein
MVYQAKVHNSWLGRVTETITDQSFNTYKLEYWLNWNNKSMPPIGSHIDTKCTQPLREAVTN